MWTVNVFWGEDIPRRDRVEVWTPIRERTGWSQCLLVTDSVPATEQRALHHTENLQVKPLSRVQLFVTPRTGACQAPPSMGFFQARKLEWVAISFFRGSAQLRDRTCVSCISCTGRRIFFFFNHCITWVKILIFQLQEKGVITLPPPPPPHPTTLYS